MNAWICWEKRRWPTGRSAFSNRRLLWPLARCQANQRPRHRRAVPCSVTVTGRESIYRGASAPVLTPPLHRCWYLESGGVKDKDGRRPASGRRFGKPPPFQKRAQTTRGEATSCTDGGRRPVGNFSPFLVACGDARTNDADSYKENWRRRPDLNRGWRFCRPLPYHLATAPIRN